MKYAASSAVHLFTLIVTYGFRGLTNEEYSENTQTTQPYLDVDYFGICPILVAAGIMLTPILMWSTTVRRYKAQAIIVCWGLLMISGLIASLVVVFRAMSDDGSRLPTFASYV
jgi:hypothetical protein